MTRERSMPAAFRLDRRRAGVLLHPTSLPGPLGSGDLGRGARGLLDWLAAAGMGWWQMLPVVPVGPGNSPYSSTSAFAGSALLIDLEELAGMGLLTRAELKPPPGIHAERVRFPAVERFRVARLRTACKRFSGGADARSRGEFDRFRSANAAWLDDYALFRALARQYRTPAWCMWPRDVRRREQRALARAREQLAGEIEFHAFVQFCFQRQWSSLRAYAAERGIGLMGDVPIFVAGASSDVWANQKLFRLDASGRAKVVSGCPPDSFSATGQLWGHPLFDWHAHVRSGFRWWIDRFRRTLSLFDAVRIDHFLGFYQHWVVSGRAKTAEHGHYEKSPGRDLFRAVHAALRSPQIVAEDLGNVVQGAIDLRNALGYPGMRVLQNAFWDQARYDQPHNYPAHCVAYTGTHDNETALGWFKGLDQRRGSDGLTTRGRALRYLNARPGEFGDAMIRALYASPARTIVLPMQDILGLDNRGRMNTPATPRGNWEWRMKPGAATARRARWLRALGETYERLDNASAE